MATALSTSSIDEQLDDDSQKAIVVATRLWNQTRHMKATILDKCRLYLKSTDVDVQVIHCFSIEIKSIVRFSNIQLLANTLSTLIAFGNKTVEQVLNEFLDAKLVRLFFYKNRHFMMNFII